MLKGFYKKAKIINALLKESVLMAFINNKAL
jgi:hypothetical protein